MILFNLLLNQQICADVYKDFNSLNILRYNIQDHLVSTTYKYKFNYNRRINSSILLLAQNNKKKASHKYNRINEIFAKSFIVSFINKYWKETIFISVPHSSIQVKINKMQGDQLALYSNEYKNLLIAFNKALMNGCIKVSMHLIDDKMSVKTLNFHNSNQAWKIVWKKGLNMIDLQDLFMNFLLQIKIYIFNTNKLKAMHLVRNKPLPLFVVLNEFNQIILAESSNKILLGNHFIDYVSQIYRSMAGHNSSYYDKYLALFFINPQDALEYRNNIQIKYSSMTNQSLKLFPTRLNLYYKLSYLYRNNIDFRLIPDLKEVNHLVNKYQYYSNISFREKQIYGKDFFQGQPIYQIQPVKAIHKKSKKQYLLNYSFNVLKNKREIEYEAVFLNYDTAIHAWLQFKKQMKNYRLPNKPKLDIYNLESFIKTCEQDRIIDKSNIIFIPSRESYQYIKSSIKLTSQLNIVQKIMSKYVHIKIITQRIIWSLTSRQPINW